MKELNKNITFDTLNAIDLFTEKPFDVNELIFHIPHASIYIPSTLGIISNKLLNKEIEKLTDWYTDVIFDVENADKLIPDFSRVFCDVERFQIDEPMDIFGRGFFYTHTDCGELFRTDINNHKMYIYLNYYRKHHDKLSELVENKLKENTNRVIIIDCHSFSDVPFNTDLDKTENRPDICIGTDDFHTPENLKLYIVNKFKELGYTVKINSPYSGTMVPKEYYKENGNVQSIMIEINRKLYMDDNKTNWDNVFKLRKIMNQIFSN